MNTKRTLHPEEVLETLSVFQLSYMLSKVLNHWYDFGGFSVGRSHRSVLLDLFMSVNRKLDVIRFDVFVHVEIAKKRAQDLYDHRSLDLVQIDLDIRNRKVLSCVILHMLMRHYKEQIVKNDELLEVVNRDLNDVDFSFKRHFPMFKLIHDVYMSGVGLSEDQLDKLVQENSPDSLRQLIEWHPRKLRG